MYSLVKPLLFAQDAETIHDFVIGGLAWAARHKTVLELMNAFFGLQDKSFEREVFGLKFPNPVGLAAGLDKNARALPAWKALGFGFVEIGSVTALSQPGNDKPRLFRLPDDSALVNRMGFNNQGATTVAARLELWRSDHGALGMPLGVNLGKSKATPLEDAPGDYLLSLRKLWDYGDYFAINVSSPNTPGLRQLQDRARLEELLGAVTGFAATQPQPKPILLKIAPDLSEAQLDEILELVEGFNLAGLIATNTTVSREGLKTATSETGGLSGAPLRARSLEVLHYLVRHTKIPVVSVGGISSADDVRERLEAGAALVQIYTGFIYQGPLMMRTIAQGLRDRHQ